jgi:cyclophilin family peptidyl-prolyl cis-trans isomerase
MAGKANVLSESVAMTSLLLAGTLLFQSPSFTPVGPKLVVTMNNGKVFEITTNKKEAPKTVAHIVMLSNKKFYDRQRVHRVEPWVTQWGAPASKTQALTTEAVLGGGSGKDIDFEESKVDFYRGVVGIASEGLQRGGDSQIFILKKDTLRLYRSYAVLGKVTKGMSVVDAIKRGDRIRSIRVVK